MKRSNWRDLVSDALGSLGVLLLLIGGLLAVPAATQADTGGGGPVLGAPSCTDAVPFQCLCQRDANGDPLYGQNCTNCVEGARCFCTADISTDPPIPWCAKSS
jgi:hypothetical protein